MQDKSIMKYDSRRIPKLYGSSIPITDITDNDELLVKAYAADQEKLNLQILPLDFKESNVSSKYPQNLDFELGPIKVMFSKMSEKGAILTEDMRKKKGGKFTILPPNTKFDLSFCTSETTDFQDIFFKKNNHDASEYMNSMVSQIERIIDISKEAMWNYIKNKNEGISLINEERVAMIKETGKKPNEEECISRAKENFVKRKVRTPVTTIINETTSIMEKIVKVEKYCYRSLNSFEIENYLPKWRKSIIEKGLNTDDRFKFLFENNEEGEDKTREIDVGDVFIPKIYAHYPVFEKIDEENISRHIEYLKSCGKNENEIIEIVDKIRKNRNGLIQTNLIDFLPYTTDITQLQYVDKRLIKSGDTCAVVVRFNAYSSPSFGIRLFFNKIIKLDCRKQRSENKIIMQNNYQIDEVDEEEELSEYERNELNSHVITNN